MDIELGGADCAYEIARGDADDTVVFLHGWGGDLNSFDRAYKAVSEWGVTAVKFAFPPVVPSNWGIYDYAACVQSFLLETDIQKPIIVGHSFGGRLAIILAAQNLCGGIVLVDSAGLKPKFDLRKKLRIAAYKRRVKCGKPLDGYGSVDYNNLTDGMRPVFVRIVNTHLDGLLPYIKCKTLLFWGKHDRDTPLYMAKRLRRAIDGSTLTVVDGGHYSYLDAHYGFISRLKSFVLEE